MANGIYATGMLRVLVLLMVLATALASTGKKLKNSPAKPLTPFLKKYYIINYEKKHFTFFRNVGIYQDLLEEMNKQNRWALWLVFKDDNLHFMRRPCYPRQLKPLDTMIVFGENKEVVNGIPVTVDTSVKGTTLTMSRICQKDSKNIASMVTSMTFSENALEITKTFDLKETRRRVFHKHEYNKHYKTDLTARLSDEKEECLREQ
ncbi:uncharacterized protein LOC128994417 [Macrosteles quadrilineatus]|uniref:uncharacterized protein LOC128994417 n=1 Tax=Macrosteles quadrilineatus TaxID=74068 RepID=UPI0023E18B51|nr:uncharacterized protein LOC128994417 [Macrosteles quadrilineatus]